ncbi:MAG: 4Fe-4S ferredoxin [Gemmatimonadota bacterium]|nr:MAG: 4Fe-4S ferredoxin [Gemmatimonadota bacterium]
MSEVAADRQSMEVDIVCVGFGPATGGFLITLSRAMQDPALQPHLQSKAMPGMPLQVVCYERADDIGFGVSGVVTRARGIRASFHDLEPGEIPMAHDVSHEKVVWLKDPIGASRRPGGVKGLDAAMASLRLLGKGGPHAVELPYIPDFMKKDDGLLLSIGQFNQWVGSLLMSSGLVQIWPGMPVAEPLVDDDRVVGVRLLDQGTDLRGDPTEAYMPGMDVRAALTVVGDGPVGPVGRKLDEHFGMPEDHHQRDWAVGMKMVVDLPTDCPLEPGTVFHTIGYPEPEIFGFFYVYPGNVASLGIFVPSWFDSPVRTSYRYLQHWMLHPYVWRYLEGGTLRSWGAKTLQESGRRGEPHLVGDGYARIGEGSGSTNVLTGSGVDEAWTTGVQLAEGVIELLKQDKPFTRANLEAAYVQRRRESWVERGARIAEKARDGFQKGFLAGFIGMGLSGLSRGRINISGPAKRPYEPVPSLQQYYDGKLQVDEIERIRQAAAAAGTSLHDALMEAAGWPAISYDGKLLISHQDALLLGGKVQAPAGYPDHVVFLYPSVCEACETKLCIEICSGEAITPGEGGVPQFDREKCIHCGACFWSCTQPREDDPERTVLEFGAGAGGLHSAEN